MSSYYYPLSNAQLQLIDNAADLLFPQQRNSFKRAVRIQVSDLSPDFSNKDVRYVIQTLLSGYGVSVRLSELNQINNNKGLQDGQETL